ncbi:hypothetical protein GCM10022630_22970 [Thermobifida alba]
MAVGLPGPAPERVPPAPQGLCGSRGPVPAGPAGRENLHGGDVDFPRSRGTEDQVSGIVSI